MHWYEWMTLAIIVTVTIIQTVRGIKAGGMGLPLFEAIGVVVAAVASTSFSPGLAGEIHVRESTVMLALFIALAVVAFMVARWLFTVTTFSSQSLDGFFSCMFGLVMAWTMAHMFLRIMISSQGLDGEIATNMATLSVVREVFEFRTWNALMRLLFRAKLSPDMNPDVG
ncbi:MAG TPA: hypothetical protein VMH22_00930 [bacterium]|nr:hypothetical protein [bacterium]